MTTEHPSHAVETAVSLRAGRPREGTAISTRLRDDQLADLDRLAADFGNTRADVIRLVIDTGLAAITRSAS